MKTKHKFTPEQIDFIRYWCVRFEDPELTEHFNMMFGTDLVFTQIKAARKNRRIRTGRDGCFKKGHVPMNKGTKGLKGANRTSFKKGNRPHTYVPVGSTTIDEDGYHKIKVADPNKWAFKHRLLWEQERGPIPKGYMVRFLDGDKGNIAIDNLELVSMRENGPLNKLGYSSLPAELKPVFRSTVQLDMKIRDRIKESA